MASVQEGWCMTPSGETVRFRVRRRAGRARRRRARLRRPALRIRSSWTRRRLSNDRQRPGGSPSPTSGPIYLDGKNVLSLVVEVDCRPWLLGGRGPWSAVVGETLIAGKLPIRIERVGRPEVKNMILRAEAVRSGQPRPGDPRPLQHGGRVPPGRLLRGRIPGAAERQPRLLGRPRRQDRLASARRRHPSADRAGARRLPRRRPREAVRRAGLVFEIEQATLDGRAHQTCGGRSLNDDVMDTLFTLLINAGKGPRIRDGVDQADDAGAAGRLPLPGAAQPGPPASRPSTTSAGRRPSDHDREDDRRAGARRHPGRRAARAALALRRHVPAAAHRRPARRPRAAAAAASRSSTRLPPDIPADDRAWAHRGLHLPGPQRARGAAGLARQLRARVPAGDGGARGRAGRRRRERPRALGEAARVLRRPHRPGGPLPRRDTTAGRGREGPSRAARAARRRGDLAPGLLPAADRADLVRLQGRHRPAGGRGKRDPPTNPRERPIKAGEIILGYPDETGELPSMPTPEVLGRNGTYVVFRKLHTRVAAYRQYLREQGGEPRRGGAAGRQDGRALAERRAARRLARARRRAARRRPTAAQRLPLRRRPARASSARSARTPGG